MLGGGGQSKRRHLLRKCQKYGKIADFRGFLKALESFLETLGQKIWFLICFVPQRVEQDAKNRIISSRSYEFFKSGSQYNYYTRTNFKLRYLITTLETYFEETIQTRGLKLSSYIPLVSFYKQISGIFEKKSIFMTEYGA